MGAWIIVAIMALGAVMLIAGRVALGRSSFAATVFSVAVAIIVLAAVFISIRVAFNFVVGQSVSPGAPTFAPTFATFPPAFATPGDGSNIVAP